MGHTAPHLSLGVVWHLVPDEVHNSDGRFVDYLDLSVWNQERFRECDPTLYDALRSIVLSGVRNVTSIQGGELLARGNTLLRRRPYLRGFTRCRRQYKAASSAAEDSLAGRRPSGHRGCDVVFLDPDNGLEVGVGSLQLRGPKYAFFDELLPFVAARPELVDLSPHSPARHGVGSGHGSDGQIEDRLGRSAFTLLYHRGSARAFFVVPAQRHWEVLFSRARTFMESRWARHLEIVRPA